MRAYSGPQWLGRLGVGALLVVAACSPAVHRDVRASPTDTTSGARVAIGARSASRVANEVRITNFTFMPGTLTIKAGQKVRWVNSDAVAHTVDLSGVVSNVLSRGDTYTLTFAAAGTYSYTCSIHPFMQGTVVVTR